MSKSKDEMDEKSSYKSAGLPSLPYKCFSRVPLNRSPAGPSGTDFREASHSLLRFYFILKEKIMIYYQITINVFYVCKKRIIETKLLYISFVILQKVFNFIFLFYFFTWTDHLIELIKTEY
jgi:hypothetical protein